MARSRSANAAAKWQAAMSSPQTQKAYADGIDATSVNPMEASANAEQAYINGVMEASQSGRRRQRLLATPISAWKDGAKGKGLQRLSSGAQAAGGKVTAHFQKFGPVYDQIKSTVAAMPKGGIANSLARVQMAMTMLKQAAGKPTT